MTAEERGRLLYECGDETDPPWETLPQAERDAWVEQANSGEPMEGDSVGYIDLARFQPRRFVQ